MKSLLTSALMMILLGSTSGCAASTKQSALPLQLRQLRVSKAVRGLEANWWKCTRSFLGICTKKELIKDTYDFNDSAVVQSLIDADFVCTVRERPQ
jgi:hypothetical protein